MLTAETRADILESIEERAAIMEYDGSMTRKQAEAGAKKLMRVYMVRIDMGPDQPPRCTVMLAPGCDLPEAKHSAEIQYGRGRVLEIYEVDV